MADVQLDYVVPTADLAPYVTVFYRLAADLGGFDEIECADHAQFRFHWSPSSASYLLDGESVEAPAIHLLAASHAARRFRCAGPMIVFGAALTAAGWGALVPADRRGARVIDAVALIGETAAALATTLRGTAGADAMAAATEPVLRALIGPPDAAMLAFVAAVDGWLAGAASPDVAALAAATGLSRRQVERRCNALHGAPPKLLARKGRALRAAAALATGAATVDDLLADGFYDQSHLIRELKHFTGRTPRRLRDDPGLFAQRSAAGGQARLTRASPAGGSALPNPSDVGFAHGASPTKG